MARHVDTLQIARWERRPDAIDDRNFIVDSPAETVGLSRVQGSISGELYIRRTFFETHGTLFPRDEVLVVKTASNTPESGNTVHEEPLEWTRRDMTFLRLIARIQPTPDEGLLGSLSEQVRFGRAEGRTLEVFED
jgi:hypothetical protein